MFCKNCGSKVADDALFCEQCGTAIKKAEDTAIIPKEKEATDTTVEKTTEVSLVRQFAAYMRKVPMKVLIPVAGAAVIGIIALIIILAVGGNGGVDPDLFYHQMNYNNGAKFAYDSERLYYISLYDDSATALFSTDYNGVNKCMLYEFEGIVDIRIAEDKIYFREWVDNENCRIGVMNKDGSELRFVVNTNESIDKFDVRDGNIYYNLSVSDDLYVCTTEGKENRKLLEGCIEFTVGSGAIYYSTDEDVIKVYDIKKETITELCKAVGGKRLALNGDILYFTCETGLKYVKVRTGEVTTVIKDSEISVYLFHNDDYLYYGKRYTDDEISQFAEYMASADGNATYYEMILFMTSELHRANQDGSDAQAVDDSNIRIFYSIYTSPKDMYYEFSFFTNYVDVVTFGEE